MSFKLLIDTNIWKRLVNKLAFERNLPILENWVKSGAVEILIPEKLNAEWKKQREIELAKIEESLRKYRKEFKERTLFGSSFNISKRNFNYAERQIVDQIKVIDEIFETSILIPETAETVLRIQQIKEMRSNNY